MANGAIENDWIEWTGGECPVRAWSGVRVQVEFRAGGTRTRKAENFSWHHRSDGVLGAFDIVAYRVVSA